MIMREGSIVILVGVFGVAPARTSQHPDDRIEDGVERDLERREYEFADGDDRFQDGRDEDAEGASRRDCCDGGEHGE